MVMHSLRITHQEELLCKFIHRHPHPVCCTEYHVVAVQVLGSHTAVVVVAVLDEAVQIVNRVQVEEAACLFLHIHNAESQYLAQLRIYVQFRP